MKPVRLSSIQRVLCLGAHADDIEIGCGGTLAAMLEQDLHCEVCWVVLSGEPQRIKEAQASAAQWLAPAKSTQIVCKSFRDGYFPFDQQIKDFFFELRSQFEPDLIFTHHRNDAHQDHRTVGELTWQTFRDHLILEYEIPKYEGDLGNPPAYIPLSKAICHRKVKSILETFRSQASKSWLTDDLLWATMRLRGVECKSPSGFAEAFHVRKMTLNW